MTYILVNEERLLESCDLMKRAVDRICEVNHGAVCECAVLTTELVEALGYYARFPTPSNEERIDDAVKNLKGYLDADRE